MEGWQLELAAVEDLLDTYFVKAELAFLRRMPAFESMLATTRTIEDFKNLCAVAEKLLDASGVAVPAARQLRIALVAVDRATALVPASGQKRELR